MNSKDLIPVCKQAIVNNPQNPLVELRLSKDPLTAGCCQSFGAVGYLVRSEPQWDVYEFNANELLKGCEVNES